MPRCVAPPLFEQSIGAGVVMEAVEQIRLLEPMIIPACGAKKAGDIVTPEDCGESWEWILSNGRFEIVANAVPNVEPVVEPDPVVTPVEPETVIEPVVEPVVEPEVVEPPESVETTEVVEPETVVQETEPAVVAGEDAQALDAIKAVLSAGKGRLADIVEKSGLTEEVVSALLTEANGFYKNQQGWYGTVK